MEAISNTDIAGLILENLQNNKDIINFTLSNKNIYNEFHKRELEKIQNKAIRKIRWYFHLHMMRKSTIQSIESVIENYKFEEAIEEIINIVPDVEEYYRSKDGQLAKLVEKLIEDYVYDMWSQEYDAPDSFMTLCDFFETWFTN
jgi:leucyl-tRNA synthetase